MSKIRAIISACALTLTVGAANAETLKTFSVTGTFESYESCINGTCSPLQFSGLGVSGTLTVCETCSPGNGEWTFDSIQLVVSGFPTLDVALSATSFGGSIGFGVDVGNVNTSTRGDLFQFRFQTPNNGSGFLTGYNGGPIDDTSGTFLEYLQFAACSSCGLFEYTNLVGSISPVSATPLPGALPLLSSGLGALGLLVMRRKRKKNAAMAAA